MLVGIDVDSGQSASWLGETGLLMERPELYRSRAVMAADGRTMGPPLAGAVADCTTGTLLTGCRFGPWCWMAAAYSSCCCCSALAVWAGADPLIEECCCRW